MSESGPATPDRGPRIVLAVAASLLLLRGQRIGTLEAIDDFRRFEELAQLAKAPLSVPLSVVTVIDAVATLLTALPSVASYLKVSTPSKPALGV